MKRFEVTDFTGDYKRVVEREGLYDVLYESFLSYNWSVLLEKGRATAVNPENNMDIFFIKEVK